MMRNVGWLSADVSGLLTNLWGVKSQKTEEFSSSAPQQIPPFYGTWKFINVFKTALYVYLC